MHSKFSEIKDEYDRFYQSLMKQGRLPMWDTGVGFWNASIAEEVYEVFKKIKLGNYKAFFDMGSGDGKVVLIAALFGVRAEGAEMDKSLHCKALEVQQKLGIQNAAFYNKDYFAHDISPYDVVFINPDKPMYRGIENKLLKELKGKLMVYGHHFHPARLKKLDGFEVSGTPVGIYKNM